MLKRAFPGSQGGFWWAVPAMMAVTAAAQYKAGQDAQDAAEEHTSQQMREQERYARNSIQWRVEDAKKAGLHPLYGIGASGAGYSPVQYVGDAGGDAKAQAFGTLGRAAEEGFARWEQANKRPVVDAGAPIMVQTKFGKLTDNDDPSPDVETGPVTPQEYETLLRHRNLRLEGDLIQSQIYESDRRRVEQEMRANNERFALEGATGAGAWEYRPDSVISPNVDKGYLTAGEHAGWTTYRLDRDFKMILPAGSSMSESVESISESKVIMAAVIARNVAEFGPQWVEHAKRYMPWLFK